MDPIARTINPNLQITPMRDDGDAITAFDVRAVVKGRGRLHSIVRPGDPFSPAFDVLHRLHRQDAGLALTAAAIAKLRHIGVLVTPAELAVAVRFACPLDTIDEAELPTRLLRRPKGPLRVSPSLRLTSTDELAPTAPAAVSVWEPSQRLAVVRDVRSGIEYPYWLSERTHALVARLTPGAPLPGDVDDADARRLFHACIVDDGGDEPFDLFAAAAHAELATRGFVVLRRLVRAPHIAALRRYYDALLAEGFVHYRDRQVPLRFAEHSEPLMTYYHAQLQPLFAAITGRSIKRSYPYFAAYRTGATLEKHTDREQCELTASLLLDQRPRPDDVSDWPLYLELPATGEQVAIHMGLGDAALYGGREIPHYRLPFAGELMTCHFYHYVDADFTGPLS